MLCCAIRFAVLFFFFKQKTAYEMRISDWSSDVCSSDLTEDAQPLVPALPDEERGAFAARRHDLLKDRKKLLLQPAVLLVDPAKAQDGRTQLVAAAASH